MLAGHASQEASRSTLAGSGDGWAGFGESQLETQIAVLAFMERAGQGHQGLAGTWAGCHVSRAPLGDGEGGSRGPRSLGTHCPWAPLVAEALASAWPTAKGLAGSHQPSGCPPCVSQLASSRSFTRQLTAPVLKKKKGKGRDFFSPPTKAQGLGERGKADAETPQLGVWPAFTLIPEHQATSHHRGSETAPPERHCIKGRHWASRLVIHLSLTAGKTWAQRARTYPESQSRAESRHRMKPSRT